MNTNIFQISVEQTPNTSNGYVAIVKGTLANSSFEISDFGVSSPEETGTTNAKKLLNAAREDAIANIRQINKANTISQNINAIEQSNVIDVKPNEWKSKDNTQKYDGGGTKPISQKQINYIEVKCAKCGLIPDEVSMKQFNKTLKELTGSQASQLIRGNLQ